MATPVNLLSMAKGRKALSTVFNNAANIPLVAGGKPSRDARGNRVSSVPLTGEDKAEGVRMGLK